MTIFKKGDVLRHHIDRKTFVEVTEVSERNMTIRDVDGSSHLTLRVSIVEDNYDMWRPATEPVSPGVIVVPSEMVDQVRHISLESGMSRGTRVILNDGIWTARKGTHGKVSDVLTTQTVRVLFDTGVTAEVPVHALDIEKTENVKVTDIRPGDYVKLDGGYSKVSSVTSYLATAERVRYRIALSGDGGNTDRPSLPETAFIERVKA